MDYCKYCSSYIILYQRIISDGGAILYLLVDVICRAEGMEGLYRTASGSRLV